MTSVDSLGPLNAWRAASPLRTAIGTAPRVVEGRHDRALAAWRPMRLTSSLGHSVALDWGGLVRAEPVRSGPVRRNGSALDWRSAVAGAEAVPDTAEPEPEPAGPVADPPRRRSLLAMALGRRRTPPQTRSDARPAIPQDPAPQPTTVRALAAAPPGTERLTRRLPRNAGTGPARADDLTPRPAVPEAPARALPSREGTTPHRPTDSATPERAVAPTTSVRPALPAPGSTTARPARARDVPAPNTERATPPRAAAQPVREPAAPPPDEPARLPLHDIDRDPQVGDVTPQPTAVSTPDLPLASTGSEPATPPATTAPATERPAVPRTASERPTLQAPHDAAPRAVEPAPARPTRRTPRDTGPSPAGLHDAGSRPFVTTTPDLPLAPAGGEATTPAPTADADPAPQLPAVPPDTSERPTLQARPHADRDRVVATDMPPRATISPALDLAHAPPSEDTAASRTAAADPAPQPPAVPPDAPRRPTLQTSLHAEPGLAAAHDTPPAPASGPALGLILAPRTEDTAPARAAGDQSAPERSAPNVPERPTLQASLHADPGLAAAHDPPPAPAIGPALDLTLAPRTEDAAPTRAADEPERSAPTIPARPTLQTLPHADPGPAVASDPLTPAIGPALDLTLARAEDPAPRTPAVSPNAPERPTLRTPPDADPVVAHDTPRPATFDSAPDLTLAPRTEHTAPARTADVGSAPEPCAVPPDTPERPTLQTSQHAEPGPAVAHDTPRPTISSTPDLTLAPSTERATRPSTDVVPEGSSLPPRAYQSHTRQTRGDAGPGTAVVHDAPMRPTVSATPGLALAPSTERTAHPTTPERPTLQMLPDADAGPAVAHDAPPQAGDADATPEQSARLTLRAPLGATSHPVVARGPRATDRTVAPLGFARAALDAPETVAAPVVGQVPPPQPVVSLSPPEHATSEVPPAELERRTLSMPPTARRRTEPGSPTTPAGHAAQGRASTGLLGRPTPALRPLPDPPPDVRPQRTVRTEPRPALATPQPKRAEHTIGHVSTALLAAAPESRPDPATAAEVSRLTGVPVERATVRRGAGVGDAARALGAAAFTHDGVVHLPDRHGPTGTTEARTLLAHELTHVAQHVRATLDPAHRPPLRPRDDLEAEAREVAQRVARATSAKEATPEPPPRADTRPVLRHTETPRHLAHDGDDVPDDATLDRQARLLYPRVRALLDADLARDRQRAGRRR